MNRIRGAFELFGEVASARVIKDKDSGRAREFGFGGTSVSSQATTPFNSFKTPTPDFNPKS
jgi:hypothetical protein